MIQHKEHYHRDGVRCYTRRNVTDPSEGAAFQGEHQTVQLFIGDRIVSIATRFEHITSCMWEGTSLMVMGPGEEEISSMECATAMDIAVAVADALRIETRARMDAETDPNLVGPEYSEQREKELDYDEVDPDAGLKEALRVTRDQQSPAAQKLIAGAAAAVDHFTDDELEAHAARSANAFEVMKDELEGLQADAAETGEHIVTAQQGCTAKIPLSNGVSFDLYGIVESTPSVHALAEALVDAIGPALGVDTGVVHENNFNDAIKVAVNLLVGTEKAGEPNAGR